MMDFNIATMIDLTILGLLAGTVFYALRLSDQLRLLKESKAELEQLVSNLSINVNRAHEAIQEMQEVASNSSEKLQTLIQDAQDMSQELQIITESGNNLADRMEEAAVTRPKQQAPQTRQEKPRPTRQTSSDHFFIRDRELESLEETNNFDDDDDSNDNVNFEDEFRNLSSRAEKQLASALRRSRKFDA